MIQPRHPRRSGVTLLEVLAAIFIMGVGLLALLTLFPLGALSMARAVRQDRAAAIAANAAGMATAFDLRNDTTVVTAMTTAQGGGAIPDPNGPSYPVLVDPFYSTLLGQGRIGLAGTDGITRVAPWYASSSATIGRWFSFQDEIEFKSTGEPVGFPASVNRPGTYTWAYLVRRPQTNNATLCEVSVIVFAERKLDVYEPLYERTFNNTTAPFLGTATTNVVTLTYNAAVVEDRPNIRKGAWLLDTTYIPRTVGVAPNQTTYGSVAARFYQVANVNDDNAGTMTLELETTLKNDVKTLVLMPNVVTVLERGTTWQP